MKRVLAFLWLTTCPIASAADERRDLFVEANVLSIFYHELGHAAIDVLEMPVFGQEEDAADVLSVLLIDALYEPDAAEAIAYDAAYGFLAHADEDQAPVFWDVHGADLQRYYNLVCLFYGADPDSREAFARELELPDERAESCAEEFDLADESWGAVLDELVENKQGHGLKFEGDADGFLSEVISAEIEALNKDFRWPVPLRVSVEPCDEPNAFYDLQTREIIICSELASYYAETWAPSR